jgi:hypothetical protein
MAHQHVIGQGLLVTRFHAHTHTLHSVGLLWTSDQPDVETSHRNNIRQTSVPSAGFEPAIPASERPQTSSLDGAANGTATNLTEQKSSIQGETCRAPKLIAIFVVSNTNDNSGRQHTLSEHQNTSVASNHAGGNTAPVTFYFSAMCPLF